MAGISFCSSGEFECSVVAEIEAPRDDNEVLQMKRENKDEGCYQDEEEERI